LCPGLRDSYREMCRLIVASRRRPALTAAEAAVEDAVRDQLEGRKPTALAEAAPRGYRTFAPVPIWPLLSPASPAAGPRPEGEESNGPPPVAASTRRKLGLRRNRGEANRRDSFIIHRFEAILSWAESMNLNRMIDDDDDEDAAKAADDQDDITLSRHDRRAASRLRMHLDLSPADADFERLAKGVTYTEWNHRTRAYMPDHVRVLETDGQPDPADGFTIDPNRLARVRRQFEALRPRRIHHPRQIEGAELDLDALIASQVEMRATGRSSDRIYQALRQTDRDLTVAFLLDTSRSTEAAVGDTSVIDVAREGLAALAGGIDAAGDRLGIWGFSSLRRDRVFLSRVKRFEEAMSPDVTARIGGLKPGHYTRLGAAIRHVSAQLEEQRAARKLLLVLTDGKPNDLDHYEGLHGIEDSHMAVREARRLGQSVHGIIIDEDGQDWFARIFGRGGFSLLPNPTRLTRALPDIYRTLIRES
ncbi:nitric oxide reductase activation protein NorD, partial [Palleronia sp.]|uniref:nitric oxide reductase activation protein NorD n=1 Tax=Palleronia sp. TaxID=1940284 RepID=UPI0035C7BE87